MIHNKTLSGGPCIRFNTVLFLYLFCITYYVLCNPGFRTWKDMAERRNEVMDMVAQVVSWAKAGGTNRFVRLPMSLIRPRACEPSEPNEDTTKVQILIREPGGGLRLTPKYSRGPAASRALWRC